MARIIWIIFIISAIHLRAQDFAPLATGIQHIPFTGISHHESGVIEASTTRLDASVAFPVYLNPKGTILASGVSWQRLELSFRNLPDDEILLAGHDQFHSVRTPVFLRKKLSARWSVFSFIIPGIESDFKGSLDMEDFSFQAALIFMREYEAGLKLGYGMFYSSSIGVPLPLPAFTLLWNPPGPWSAEVIVPVRMKLSYDLSDWLSIGPIFRMTGNQYHGNPDDWGLADPKMEIRDLTTSLGLTARPKSWLGIDLDLGLAYGRKFEFHDADKLVIDLNPGINWYLGAGIKVTGPGQ